MFRYFLEISYKGTKFKGLQKQNNGVTIEGALLACLTIYYKHNFFFNLTAASRTDTGVHAHQNFFHLDFQCQIPDPAKDIYHLNAIIDEDIVIKNIFAVKVNAHARFDAINRTYEYFIYKNKNPFLSPNAMYIPFALEFKKLEDGAKYILEKNNFMSFCKKHAQNKTYTCKIFHSAWTQNSETLIFNICADRFLRGMIRALVGTMLLYARNKITFQEFESVFIHPLLASANFNTEPQGLFLKKINYPTEIFIN